MTMNEEWCMTEGPHKRRSRENDEEITRLDRQRAEGRGQRAEGRGQRAE